MRCTFNPLAGTWPDCFNQLGLLQAMCKPHLSFRTWWKHTGLSNLNVKALFSMLAGSHKSKPIRNKQKPPICSLFLSKFVKWSLWLPHTSWWYPSLISSMFLPRERVSVRGSCPLKCLRGPILGRAGSGRREGQDAAAWDLFLNTVLQPYAAGSWLLLCLVTAKEVTRGFINLNSPGVILLL